MRIFPKTYHIKPNTIGYLYKNNIFEKKLTPGVYTIFDFLSRAELFTLSETSKLISITNQEVLTKDNIAFRFSFNIIYKVIDGEKLLKQFALDKASSLVVNELEQRLGSIAQIYVRSKISETESESLNEKRSCIIESRSEDLIKSFSDFGTELVEIQVKDITFPKSIQDLFSKQLESKVRAKSDLENARTAVATARALKNASELMKDDENIKFVQLLEAIAKISERGKHTFMIGDLYQLTKQK